MDYREREAKFTTVGIFDRRQPITVRRERLLDLNECQRRADIWNARSEGLWAELDVVLRQVMDMGGTADFRRWTGGWDGAWCRWTLHRDKDKPPSIWRSWDSWKRLGLPADTQPARVTFGERIAKLDIQARLCLFSAQQYETCIMAAMERVMLDELNDAKIGWEDRRVHAFVIGGRTRLIRWVAGHYGTQTFEHLGEVKSAVTLSRYPER